MKLYKVSVWAFTSYFPFGFKIVEIISFLDYLLKGEKHEKEIKANTQHMLNITTIKYLSYLLM